MAKREKKPGDEVVSRAKERYKLAVNDQLDQRARSAEAIAFCDPANQWDDRDKATREAKGIPCMVVDRMTPFIDQIANDQRQNRQSIDVHPVDDTADVETCKIIKGLIRHIEYISKADVAVDTAFINILRGGFGWLRLYLDYCDSKSFDQEVKIARVANAMDVYIDPSSTEVDGADMMWAMIQIEMSQDEYKLSFPDSDLAQASTSQWKAIGMRDNHWMSPDAKTVKVLEYFEKVKTRKTIYQLDDGSVTDTIQEGQITINKRDTYDIEIKHYVINSIEVLAETTFPGDWIPIVPVYGQELIIEGKRLHTGLVHRLMDIQKMVNYWKSAQTHMIALAPKAPWIGPRGFRGDMEQQWANVNREPYATIEYEPVIVNGQVMPPPERNVQEPAIGAITNALMSTEEDLKAVTGIYDPALGNRGDAGQSGVAIQRLQKQGQIGNFHFADNLSRALRQLGIIIVGLIPHVYDMPRAVRIIGVDDEHNVVKINQPSDDINPETGEPYIYDLTTGRYDVVVSSGPSFATRRAENLAVMLDMTRALPPELTSVIADLIASQMDTPIANEISDRLKKMLPPQLQQEDKGQKGGQVPPQVAAQMQTLMQQHEQLTQALNAAQDELENQTRKAEADAAMKKAELDSKERIALIDNQTKLVIAELQLQSSDAQFALRQELDMIQARIGMLGAGNEAGGEEVDEAPQAMEPEPQPMEAPVEEVPMEQPPIEGGIDASQMQMQEAQGLPVAPTG